MTVSKHHSLIATGMQSGLVAIWDLQTGKCDRVHQAAKSSINFLSFVEEYPMLAAGGAQGYMSVWATSRAPKEGRDLRYQCMGRFRNQNRMTRSGDIQEGITCGALKVVQVGIKNQIFKSDQIMYDDSSFSIRTCLKRTAPQDIDQQPSDLDKFIQQEITPKEEVLEEPSVKLVEAIGKLKEEMAEGQRSTIEANSARNLDTMAYDRVIAIIGTDNGFIKLWDLTYMTSQKPLRRKTDNTLNMFLKGLTRRIHRQKEKSEDYQRQRVIEQTKESTFNVDQSGQIIKLEKIPVPVYQAPKISYNPWSRSSTNLDPHSAKSFLKQAEDADFKIDAEEFNAQNIVQKTMDAKHGLEMQFRIHNAEQYYQDNYLKKDHRCDHKHEHKHDHHHHHDHDHDHDEKHEDGENAEEDCGDHQSHQHSHNSRSGGSPPGDAASKADSHGQNVNVYKHLYDSGDDEEVKRK